MTAEIQLPPLPKSLPPQGPTDLPRFDQYDMRDYATTAVLADRQARWMPIETAPADRSITVLVFAKDSGVTVAKFWREAYAPSGRLYSYAFIDSQWAVEPTHWMPLPPAPQPVATEQEGNT